MKLKQILYVKKKNKSSRTNAFFSSEDNFIKNYGSDIKIRIRIRVINSDQTQLIYLDRSGKLIRITTDQDRIRIRDTVYTILCNI